MTNDILRRRLFMVGAVLGLLGIIILNRLVSLYIGLYGTSAGYFAQTALTQYRSQITVLPPRGEIYDRNGLLLATNTVEYEIGMSPSLIIDGEETAQILSEVLELPYDDLLEEIQSDAPYVQLFRGAPATKGERLLELDLDGMVITPIPRRFYPHDTLAAHVLGFVNYDNIGFYGVEGYYDDQLEGRIAVDSQSRIPFEATGGEGWATGANFYLTIDSEIQHLAETTLAKALQETGAESGTILVIDPKTGEILAMANAPTFNPNRFYAGDGTEFANPAVSFQYEPGSTLKVLTMAIALENGIVSPDSVYEDNGVIEVGGASIYNWDRASHGVTTMTDLLAKSLNVGAAYLSVSMGPTRFYGGLDGFGLGDPTGIDLEGEVAGLVKRPGNADWFESDLGTNAFGQGLAATPLQVAMAIGAIANDGLLMQPHMAVQRIEPDGEVINYSDQAVNRPISSQTAAILARMMQDALEREASSALVEGYSIAGKTGTSQIPVPGGYDPERTITSFVGFGPVDDPQFLVLIKLDEPTSSRWGSDTAAPVFGYFVERLVVLMGIPPDNIRLASAGG